MKGKFRELTAALARETFNYDAESGRLTWAVGRRGTLKGSLAGHLNEKGYRVVEAHGKRYRVHAIVWLLRHGVLPEQIDHINGDKSDNRIANLRLATNSQNHANKPKYLRGTSSRWKGVTWDASRQLWQARIKVDRRVRHLGRFEDECAAAVAYDGAARKFFGEFARLNFPEGAHGSAPPG